MSADYLNLIFVLISGVIAFFAPFELIVFSYAILGPAHYLTQIAWMHERKYFLKSRWEILPLILLTTLMVIFPDNFQDLILVTFFTAIITFLIEGMWQRLVAIALLSGVTYFYQQSSGPILFLFFLPTLIHVFVFSFMFILHGALTKKGWVAYLVLALMLIISVSLFSLSGSETSYSWEQYRDGGMGIFHDDIMELLTIFKLENEFPVMVAMSKFIAFAYTFHYLNWFSKTKMIGWHKLKPLHLTLIALLYISSLSLYLYDFLTGVKVLAWLSLLHVILELPLNAKTFKGITAKVFNFE
jgi:hypothetical protein